MREHRDMLLLDADGAAQNVTWWNSYTLCPAYQPTIDYFKAVTRRSSATGALTGSRSTGSTSMASRPAITPRTSMRSPKNRSRSCRTSGRRSMRRQSRSIPDAVIEICPCGTSFAFYNMPDMNQARASDPLIVMAGPAQGQDHQGVDGAIGALCRRPCRALATTPTISPRPLESARSFSDQIYVAQDTVPTTMPQDGFVLTPKRKRSGADGSRCTRRTGCRRASIGASSTISASTSPKPMSIAKDGRLYYAFYANRWDGPVDLRGLGEGALQRHRHLHRPNRRQRRPQRKPPNRSFESFLLLEATSSVTATALSTAHIGRKTWLDHALSTMVLWGVWGAFTGISAQRGFPDTLVYCVWSLTMIPAGAFCAARDRWRAGPSMPLGHRMV